MKQKNISAISIETIRSFVKTTLNNADQDQSNLLIKFAKFIKSTKPRDFKKKKLKQDTIERLTLISMRVGVGGR